MAKNGPSFLKTTDVQQRSGTNYPAAVAAVVAGREKRVLGDPFGLAQFGVNLTTLAPGSQSSHRHWHEREDEFIYVLDGEITLVDDAGEHLLTAGMCAGFKAGVADGHCLINRSKAPATYLEIGSRSPEERSTYPDTDLKGVKASGKWTFTKKDGSAF
ncbi:MAG: cupin domain-containing protein [Rhizobiales bacterium]|nr:cupin domain-containing protein [Hyphomicrobiales bacterium]